MTEAPRESRPSRRPPHADDIDQLIAGLGTDPTMGLSSAEVEERLARIGPNRLSEPPRKSTILSLAGQLANPLVLTLLGAAVIATLVGLSQREGASFLSKFGDALAILLIVIVNALLGFVQERRAEAAMLALKSMTSPTARVRRNGTVVIAIEDGPLVNFCKPAVDPLFASAAEVWGNKVLALVLTGMGADGLAGAKSVVAAGGSVVAQDEATSVVWGMPGQVTNAGLCSAVLPLPEIAARLTRLFVGDRS